MFERGERISMPVFYNSGSDTLTVTLVRGSKQATAFETGDVAAFIDDNDTLVKITISNASRFIKQALANGVEVAGAQSDSSTQNGMVWHRVKSSMISAFGYDENERVLEVTFNRTGVYQYFDVPVDVYQGLLYADSKGRYMRDCVIDMFYCMKK